MTNFSNRPQFFLEALVVSISKAKKIGDIIIIYCGRYFRIEPLDKWYTVHTIPR